MGLDDYGNLLVTPLLQDTLATLVERYDKSPRLCKRSWGNLVV